MEDGWIALGIAILSKDYLTPEMALESCYTGDIPKYNWLISKKDVEDMMKMRGEKITYAKIGEMYGISDSTVCHRITSFKKERGLLEYA
jgi:hypothetical protein